MPSFRTSWRPISKRSSPSCSRAHRSHELALVNCDVAVLGVGLPGWACCALVILFGSMVFLFLVNSDKKFRQVLIKIGNRIKCLVKCQTDFNREILILFPKNTVTYESIQKKSKMISEIPKISETVFIHIYKAKFVVVHDQNTCAKSSRLMDQI